MPSETLEEADSAFRHKDYATAVRILKEHEPKDAATMFNLGIAQSASGNIPEANKSLEKAYGMDPKMPDIALSIAKLALLSKDYERAQKWLQIAKQVPENYAEAKRTEDSITANIQKEESERLGMITKLHFFKPDKTFKDAVGIDKIKKKLEEEVLIPIIKPDLPRKYGKDANVAMILYGPPGCGKTFTASCLAGEAAKANSKTRMAIIQIKAILNMYVGNSEKNIGKIFEEARKQVPCILFIDEFNALGASRAHSQDQASDASTVAKVVDELLTEMDGIERNPEGLFIIAATNRPWEIDEALKRSGRFDEIIYIGPPKYKERKRLFELYLGNKPKSGRFDYGRLARATSGYSQSDIKTISNKATIPSYVSEYKTGVEKPVRMIQVLMEIRKRKSSLDSWYQAEYKELIGTTKTETDGKQKRTVFMTGKLSSEEKNLYAEMIGDITYNTSRQGIAMRNLERAIGLYLF